MQLKETWKYHLKTGKTVWWALILEVVPKIVHPNPWNLIPVNVLRYHTMIAVFSRV